MRHGDSRKLKYTQANLDYIRHFNQYVFHKIDTTRGNNRKKWQVIEIKAHKIERKVRKYLNLNNNPCPLKKSMRTLATCKQCCMVECRFKPKARQLYDLIEQGNI